MSFLKTFDRSWVKMDEFNLLSPRWALLFGAIVGVISGIVLGLVTTISEFENLWQIVSLVLLGGSSILVISGLWASEDGSFQEVVTASFTVALGFILGCTVITYGFWAFATFQTIHAVAAVFIPMVFVVAAHDEWAYRQEEKAKTEGSEASEATPSTKPESANQQGFIASW